MEHINNTCELQDWGKKQHNCLLSYNKDVAAGIFQIYRVTTPEEEATLSIFRDDDNKYLIDQLLSKRNRSVRTDTNRYVQLWLNNNLEALKKCPLNFPVPQRIDNDIIIKPLVNLEFIIGRPFDQMISIRLEDVTKNQNIFFYELKKPEAGIIALKEVNGQWDIVLGRTIAGCHRAK